MDNRWYGIIIILIVGLSCMYLIASSSNSVASAVVIVDDISVTLPNNFIIGPKDSKHVVFKNDNNESIELKYISDGNNSLKEFNKEIKLLEKDKNIEITNNSSSGIIKNITCTDNSSNNSYMLSYFDLYDRTLLINSSGYDNLQNQKNDVINILNTIKPDFKQNRD